MTDHQAAMLFLGIAVILVLARLLGAGARAVGQPPVLGEILAGVLLGPTLFGGAVTRALFPMDVRPFLTSLADLGLVLFMFVIGYDLDAALVRGRAKVAAGVSLGSMLLPFGLGAVLAFQLAHRHQIGHSHTGFVLFIGAAMSVTAFPVLARILADRRMQHTELGGLALAAAGVGDLLAWGMLAVVTTVAGGGLQWRVMLAPVYLALMAWVVRPLFQRLFTARENQAGLTPTLLAAVATGLMLSCAAVEWMHVDFIFGAFVFGLAMPRVGPARLREGLRDSLGTVGTVFLLPVFFVIAGLKVDLSKLNGDDLGELGLILLVAVGGKFVGAFSGARLLGLGGRDSAVMATLMNTRGLTELVILTVGLQLGVLDTGLYSLMVVMALVTTFMTGPLIRLLRGSEPQPDLVFSAAAPVVEPVG
ncbi:cation:proton antiporter [Streptacidiphilus melanogenes]|uniref:cation:proton antiporter n=1 Tax=Streptacidiphilus melanogenes TaxID=411235 RepID=UPI0005A5DDF8|nr:cation:proton antiporter [Streptacidiphilus melanogenes]